MFKPKYLIDTNIFVRYFVIENRRMYKECRALLEKIQKEEIDVIVPTLVLSEISWVLRSNYKRPKKEIINCLNSIKNIDSVRFICKENISRALRIWKRYNMKFIDAMICSIDDVYERKIIIVSYDKDFDKMKKVKNIMPNKLLK